jgi:hypothetical protein
MDLGLGLAMTCIRPRYLQSYQVFRVEVLEGPYKGLITEIDYGKRQVRPEGSPLEQVCWWVVGKGQEGFLDWPLASL